MRVLKHGLSVSEMAVSALPGRPHAVGAAPITIDAYSRTELLRPFTGFGGSFRVDPHRSLQLTIHFSEFLTPICMVDHWMKEEKIYIIE